jgi:DNA segregation ATPase FtsK/SpoIIIE, S-DNA-T family
VAADRHRKFEHGAARSWLRLGLSSSDIDAPGDSPDAFGSLLHELEVARDGVIEAVRERARRIGELEAEVAKIRSLPEELQEELDGIAEMVEGQRVIIMAKAARLEPRTAPRPELVDIGYLDGRLPSSHPLTVLLDEARRQGAKANNALFFAWYHRSRLSKLIAEGLASRRWAERMAEERHREVVRITAELTAACRAAGERAEAAAARALVACADVLGKRAPSMRPGWSGDVWDGWVPPTGVEPVHLGMVSLRPEPLADELRSVPDVRMPLHTDFRSLGGLLLQHGNSSRDRALGTARAAITRLLAAIPPGKAQFLFFDPLGLGQAVSPFLALADHDRDLVGGKVWTSADELRGRLRDVTVHIETVIQKYLRGEYETIDEYNAAADEIAEPYRIVVVFDFPTQFDETAFHQLCRIVANGPRCGVYTLLVVNGEAPMPYNVSLGELPALPMIDVGNGQVDLWTREREPIGTFDLQLDDDPLASATTGGSAGGTNGGQAVIDRIVDAVGRGGRHLEDVTVGFGRAMELYGRAAAAGIHSHIPRAETVVAADDPATWWRFDSSEAICGPLGRSGARDVAALRFDSEIRSGALLVGRPGAGKSTLLHTYIAGLATLYGPDELELYLIDFKEGVEFKAYAEHALPHARCVAVESEREFGLSVLEAIVAEQRRRAELIRGLGGQQTAFARVREATAERLPRILLVFDEFHVLFAEDDKIGATAADLLETIIRQGRGFGVHVLLGSQSLSGLDALGRHVLQLLPIRILLPSSEADAATTLGESNDAWKTLKRRGEGVLNSSGGAVEANIPFQTSFQTEDERLARLRALRAAADANGFERRPVVFEGYAAARLDDVKADTWAESAREGTSGLTLQVGAPLGLSGPVGVALRRESGANVLVVARPGQDVPLSLLATALLSALATRPDVRIQVIDFTAIDEGVEDALAPLIRSGRVTLTRRRTADRVLAEVAAEVDRRVDEDDVRAPSTLLVVYGAHRARDLDPLRSEVVFGDDDGGPDLLGPLRKVVTDGPEVGVHTWIWVDSVGGLKRRLPTAVQRELGFRIAGTMSRDDSVDLLDVDTAAKCRAHQVVVLDDATGLVQRATAYAVPDTGWIEEVATTLGGTD